MSVASLYSIKPRFQSVLGPVADALARREVNPDALTLAAVGCAAVGGGALLLSVREPAWLWAIPVTASARLTLNALDGMVATRRGVARAWGKVLNELCDRVSDLAFFGPLLVLPGVDHTWAALALSTMLLVAFVGVLGEAAGATRQYGGVMGKADRMAWLGLAAAASALLGTDLPLQALPILVVGGGMLTLVQRLERIHAAV